MAMTEDQFRQLLERSNAALFGQMTQYLDKRLDSLRDELKVDTTRIYDAVDGIAKRIETDQQERAAISEEQARHAHWIGQIAEATGPVSYQNSSDSPSEEVARTHSRLRNSGNVPKNLLVWSSRPLTTIYQAVNVAWVINILTHLINTARQVLQQRSAQ